MLHNFCDVFDWTRHIHVVSVIFSFRLNFSRIDVEIFDKFSRFPDFLIQLQSYSGSPKTLCEIVRPKSVANSTDLA